MKSNELLQNAHENHLTKGVKAEFLIAQIALIVCRLSMIAIDCRRLSLIVIDCH